VVASVVAQEVIPSLPPNTMALGKFEEIVTALRTGTMELPMKNATERFTTKTFERNTAPIRTLLGNGFTLVPIDPNEPDLWRILEAVTVSLPANRPSQLQKLPSAIRFFLKLREHPTIPVESSQSEVRSSTTSGGKKKRKRASRTYTGNLTKISKLNDLHYNTEIVRNAIMTRTIELPEHPHGKPYEESTIKRYCSLACKLLKGELDGVAIDPDEWNPFHALNNILIQDPDIVKTLDDKYNKQMSSSIKFVLKVCDRFDE